MLRTGCTSLPSAHLFAHQLCARLTKSRANLRLTYLRIIQGTLYTREGYGMGSSQPTVAVSTVKILFLLY